LAQWPVLHSAHWGRLETRDANRPGTRPPAGRTADRAPGSRSALGADTDRGKSAGAGTDPKPANRTDGAPKRTRLRIEYNSRFLTCQGGRGQRRKIFPAGAGLPE